METNKELITNLILQDLRHYQLIALLGKAGLDMDLHDLDIIHIVSDMMDVPLREQTSDQWSELYFNFLDRAADFEVSKCGASLKPLAEECFEVLVACKRVLGK